MLNKHISKTIIAISKILLPVILLVLLAPQLLQFSSGLNRAGHFLQAHQIPFLIMHCIFYLALYGLWPVLIRVLINRCQYELNEIQIQLALQTRVYLLLVLIFFELLIWWK